MNKSLTQNRLISDTIAEDIRQPRVSGRIVKLYSGSRPEPIYCSGEGFQPDPTNCGIFYRCVKSSTQKFTVFRVSIKYVKYHVLDKIWKYY